MQKKSPLMFEAFDVDLAQFGFNPSKIDIIPSRDLPVKIYRGSSSETFVARSSGEQSLGEGVYFSPYKDQVEPYGDFVLEVEMPKHIKLCRADSGDIGTIEGGDAGDEFTDKFVSLLTPEQKNAWYDTKPRSIWRIIEKEEYEHVAKQIRREYEKHGCQGLYQDWQLTIWDEDILRNLKYKKIAK